MIEIPGSGKLIEELSNLGDKRIAAMDVADIDMQVLSLTAPVVQQLDAKEAVELAREANDYLAAAIRCHPSVLQDLPLYQPLLLISLLRSWSAWLMNMASKEEISMDIPGAVT